jgi:hypothetical protein
MSNWTDDSGRRADPERIIDRIHREESRAGYHASSDRDRQLKWDNPDHREMVRSKLASTDGEALLPAFGPEGRAENARDDCGDPHPSVCADCGHSVEFGRTCSQSVCARCGVAWVRDSAIQKAAKLRRIRKEKHQHTPDREHQKIHHQIISPPIDFFYALARDGYSLEEAQEVARDVAKDILDEMRAPGLLISHSFRGERDDGSVADDETRQDDQGMWKELLNSGREWWGDVREELAWMPHFHCVVVGDYLEGGDFTRKVEDETGWIINRIAGDDGVSVENDGAMARLTTYSLSHADIYVNPEGNNQSGAWWVGTFDGDIIKSDSRFTARPHDLDWSDGKVRDYARTVLGLRSGTTNCGADLPSVDDPDHLAEKILEELYPDDDPRVPTDVVLEHLRRGNISVDVATSSGGGGDVTVRDAFGEPVGAAGFGSPGDLPDVPTSPASADGGAEAVRTIVDDDGDDQDGCGCGDDHDDGDDGCDGTLIPLEVARQRGLLDDEEWIAEAPLSDEARAADDEWTEDLDPWRTESPGAAIGAG